MRSVRFWLEVAPKQCGRTQCGCGGRLRTGVVWGRSPASTSATPDRPAASPKRARSGVETYRWFCPTPRERSLPRSTTVVRPAVNRTGAGSNPAGAASRRRAIRCETRGRATAGAHLREHHRDGVHSARWCRSRSGGWLLTWEADDLPGFIPQLGRGSKPGWACAGQATAGRRTGGVSHVASVRCRRLRTATAELHCPVRTPTHGLAARRHHPFSTRNASAWRRPLLAITSGRWVVRVLSQAVITPPASSTIGTRATTSHG